MSTVDEQNEAACRAVVASWPAEKVNAMLAWLESATAEEIDQVLDRVMARLADEETEVARGASRVTTTAEVSA